ncbi:unnamed protein product [Sphagnum troendelagicum]
MAFVADLEAHLRMISTEATRKYPIVKDAAERAMFKLIAHDVVLPSALPSILATLKEVSTEAFLLFTRSGLTVSLNDFIAIENFTNSPDHSSVPTTSNRMWSSQASAISLHLLDAVGIEECLAEIFGAKTGLAAQARNEPLSEAGRLGVRLFEDLTSLAGGGRVCQ